MKRKSVAIAASSALLAGLGVGAGIAAATHTNTAAEDASSHTSKSILDGPLVMADGRDAKALTKNWPVNKHGLTYGEPTMADVDTPGAVLPDLVPVRDDEGKDGFVYYHHKMADLYDPPRPQDLGEKTGRRLDDRGEIVIDVFAADGKTVTGVYSLTHPEDDEM